MKIIQQKITNHFQNKLPFVVYNKPNTFEVSGLFQQNDDLHRIKNNFDIKGFVFAPFHSDKETILIPFETSEFIKENFSEKKNLEVKETEFYNENSKSEHINLVEKGVKAIENDQFKKVVLSRKEEIKDVKIDIIETYQKLLQTYPNAFVYVWFHPKVGLWFGATPETLLKLENNRFTTMALAGTQIFNENEQAKWNQKEIDEQQFVTDYILNKLSEFSNKLEHSKTETVKAGSLLHLRTEINGELDVTKENSLFSLVSLLHPTPAVCGLPKEAAKQFILKNENYNRSYYTGYLGEINMGLSRNDSQLFVNLRCMEISENKVIVYVGGGVTKDSVPIKEWQETVDKSNIMLKVL